MQGQDYWNDLVDSKGRQILSSQQFELIKTVSDNILNHPHTESYFQDDNDVDMMLSLLRLVNLLSRNERELLAEV